MVERWDRVLDEVLDRSQGSISGEEHRIFTAV